MNQHPDGTTAPGQDGHVSRTLDRGPWKRVLLALAAVVASVPLLRLALDRTMSEHARVLFRMGQLQRVIEGHRARHGLQETASLAALQEQGAISGRDLGFMQRHSVTYHRWTSADPQDKVVLACSMKHKALVVTKSGHGTATYIPGQ